MILATGALRGVKYQNQPIQPSELAKAFSLPKVTDELKIRYKADGIPVDRFKQQKMPASVWLPNSYTLYDKETGDSLTLHLCTSISPKPGGGFDITRKDVVLLGSDNVFSQERYEDFVYAALSPLIKGSPSQTHIMEPFLSVYDRAAVERQAAEKVQKTKDLYTTIANLSKEEVLIKGRAMNLPGITSTSTAPEILGALYTLAGSSPELVASHLSSESTTIRGVLLKAMDKGVFEQKGNSGIPAWFWAQGPYKGSVILNFGESDSINALVNFISQQENYQAFWPEILRQAGLTMKEEAAPAVSGPEEEVSNVQAKIITLMNAGKLNAGDVLTINEKQYPWPESAVPISGVFNKIEEALKDPQIRGAFNGTLNALKKNEPNS